MIRSFGYSGKGFPWINRSRKPEDFILILDMIKKYIFLGLLIGLNLSVFAQHKANYRLAEKFSSENLRHFDNSITIYPEFLKGSDKFWYSFTTDEGKNYYLVDPLRRKKTLLFDAGKLVARLTELTRENYNVREFSPSNLKLAADGQSFTFNVRSDIYRYTIASDRLEKTGTEPRRRSIYSWMKFSPDSNYILFAKNHNLYIMGNKDKGMDTTHVQLTTDGVAHFSYANEKEMVDSLECESLGVWMKDSKKVYVIREDERKAGDLFVVDVLATPRPKLNSYRYVMPGDTATGQSELSVIDITTRKQVRIQTEKFKDQYLDVLFTDKKAETIYFERKNRAFNTQEICRADVYTGESKVLIHEECKPYLDYKMFAIHFLNDGKEILYRSERTGMGHYYLYDNQGNFKRTITSGNWVAGPVTEIDTAGRTIYFYALGIDPKIDPYYYVLCSASLDRPSAVRQLTHENATHSVQFSKSFRYFVDIYGRVDLEPHMVLKDIQGKVVMDLEKPDLRRLYEMGWKMPERFKVKAADGVTDLYGVMWKPFDFDSTRQYPIISSVYPGPFYEYVPTQFEIADVDRVQLAQLGFIVIAVGHRGGSPMRGKFYQGYSYGQMRDYPLADDKYAIEQLADRYPFIDISKVGMFGHSGGGFMSAAALLTYPDFYSAAVAAAGNHDNRIFNMWWGETFNGAEEVKKTVKDSVNGDREEVSYKFRVGTNMQLAGRYKGGLLLAHGWVDDNVHPAHTLRLAAALIKARKNFDMIILPDADHGFGGKAETFFERKKWFHFAKYLLGDDSADHFYDVEQYKKK